MKKLITLILSIALVASLSACSNNGKSGTETTAPTALTETTQPPASDTEPTEAPTETEPSTTQAQQETDAPTEVDPSVQSVDLSAAAMETSKEAPAEVGQWIKATTYNPKSKVYEIIYWRVVNTTFDCQAEIDRYTSEGGWYSFDPLEDEDLAYCMLNYEVYFPKEFSAADYGISSSDLSLRAESPDGGGIEWKGMSYIGLGSCYDISVDQDIMPGDVFKGQCIYVMINDPEVEYIFEYGYTEAGAKLGEGEYLHAYSKAK